MKQACTLNQRDCPRPVSSVSSTGHGRGDSQSWPSLGPDHFARTATSVELESNALVPKSEEQVIFSRLITSQPSPTRRFWPSPQELSRLALNALRASGNFYSYLAFILPVYFSLAQVE
jgi:hypothetical protein